MIKSSSEVFQELNNSDIFNTLDCGETNHYKIAYLEFVELDETNDGEINTFTSSISRDQEPEINRMGLRLKMTEGPLDYVNINPDDVESLDAHDKITDVAVDMIIERAYKNSERDNPKYFNVDFLKAPFYFSDEKKRGDIQVPNHGRKLIARILSVSNLIAINGRRGAGNYVILPESLYRILENTLMKKYKGLYKPSKVADTLSYMNILCSDKLADDVFIVGRKPQPEEPGLHLVTSDNNLSNYMVKSPEDLVHKLGFKLVWVGDESKDYTVYGCKVNWTNETI
jgi:hypothetical protein